MGGENAAKAKMSHRGEVKRKQRKSLHKPRGVHRFKREQSGQYAANQAKAPERRFPLEGYYLPSESARRVSRRFRRISDYILEV